MRNPVPASGRRCSRLRSSRRLRPSPRGPAWAGSRFPEWTSGPTGPGGCGPTRIRAYRRERCSGRQPQRRERPGPGRCSATVVTGTFQGPGGPDLLLEYSNVPRRFRSADFQQVLFTSARRRAQSSLQPQDLLRGAVQRHDLDRGTVFALGAAGHDEQLLRGRLQRHRRRELLPQRRAAVRPDAHQGAGHRLEPAPSRTPSGRSSTTTGPTACRTRATTTAWWTS